MPAWGQETRWPALVLPGPPAEPGLVTGQGAVERLAEALRCPTRHHTCGVCSEVSRNPGRLGWRRQRRRPAIRAGLGRLRTCEADRAASVRVVRSVWLQVAVVPCKTGCPSPAISADIRPEGALAPPARGHGLERRRRDLLTAPTAAVTHASCRSSAPASTWSNRLIAAAPADWTAHVPRSAPVFRRTLIVATRAASGQPSRSSQATVRRPAIWLNAWSAIGALIPALNQTVTFPDREGGRLGAGIPLDVRLRAPEPA